jgi:hypothetical protein
VLLKRYVFTVAVALSATLAGAGAALALNHPGKGHSAKSLVPSFAPRPDVRQETAHTTKAARKHRPAPNRQPRELHRLRGTTSSLYERTAKPWILARQGCVAARRHETGVVILDFGKPAHRHHAYGTILFSNRFASNHKISIAMVGYARGYVRCLHRGSRAHVTLARGTSNYHPDVPSAYTAGVRWARATNKFGRLLNRYGLSAHVESAAANDAEPAWDRSFHKTKQFFYGFRAAVHQHTLYDYGSLDGGVGAIWSAKQMWYVAGGLRHTQVLPEIYYPAMAQQWAELARIAHRRYHKDVHFAGVMTQGGGTCNCGYTPHAAHSVLAHALASQGVGHLALPRGGTNIVG